jgi:hypothetical protein
MATGTGHRWSDVFQPANTTREWTWGIGEREHHWSFSFRPFQANSNCEVQRHFTTSDNNLAHVDHLIVSTSSGNIFRFSATWVSGA